MTARALLPCLLFLGCEGSLFRITVEESSEVQIGGRSVFEQLLGDIGFDGFATMDLTEAAELQNQGVAPGDIREVYLVDFVLTATDPASADLSFLDRMDLLVSAPDLPTVRVATQNDFPAGVSSVTFELEDVDLTDYLVSEAMTLTTDVTGRRPDDDTVVRAEFAIEVGVTRQGACSQL